VERYSKTFDFDNALELYRKINGVDGSSS